MVDNVRRVAADVGVGSSMLVNILYATEYMAQKGNDLAAVAQDYAGSAGSGAVKYGLPIVAFIGTLALGVLAVRATDYYIANGKLLEW